MQKTKLLARNRELFLACLRYDIERLIKMSAKRQLLPAVRINGTSDLPWIAHVLAGEFPRVQFYDYTKHKSPWLRLKPNYHLTYSHSGLGRELESRPRLPELPALMRLTYDS